MISPEGHTPGAMCSFMRHCGACGDDRSLQGLMFVHSHELCICLDNCDCVCILELSSTTDNAGP